MFPDSLDVQPEKLLIPEYVENDGEKIELGQKLYTAKIDQYGTIYIWQMSVLQRMQIMQWSVVKKVGKNK